MCTDACVRIACTHTPPHAAPARPARSMKTFGKIEDDVPLFFKRLNYPFAISKSALFAVGSPHSWPAVLAAMTWLVELLNYNAKVRRAGACPSLYVKLLCMAVHTGATAQATARCMHCLLSRPHARPRTHAHPHTHAPTRTRAHRWRSRATAAAASAGPACWRTRSLPPSATSLTTYARATATSWRGTTAGARTRNACHTVCAARTRKGGRGGVVLPLVCAAGPCGPRAAHAAKCSAALWPRRRGDQDAWAGQWALLAAARSAHAHKHTLHTCNGGGPWWCAPQVQRRG